MARSVIHRAGGGEEVVPSKLVTTLRAGDRVVFETAGGGGYGDPAARDPEQVRADLADGKISADGAKAYAPVPDGTG
jgi:N-methylhydantoinase B